MIGSVTFGRPPITGLAVGPEDACGFAIAPLRAGVTLAGGSLTVTVPAPQGCGWSIPSPASWLTPTSPTSGVGPGSVAFSASPATDPRTAEFRVSGQVIPVFQSEPRILIDNLSSGAQVTQPFSVSGWAIERWVAAPGGAVLPAGLPGAINAIHLWAYPASGTPIFIGETEPFRSRSDIAAIYGSQFAMAGFSVPVSGLAPGTYTLVAFLLSRATGRFDAVSSTTVRVDSQHFSVIDSLKPDAQVTTPFQVSGWAIDTRAPSGTGVDAVHVYAYPDAGGSPVFLGAAARGLVRSDVAAFTGSRFLNSGFALAGDGLGPGGYTIVAYSHSSVSGTFAPSVVHVTVTGSAEPLQIESVRTKTSSPRIEIYGWAIDRRASSGVGVSGIHFYAYPAGGGDPIFLGAATLGAPRDEVAAMFGARFRNAHFFVRGDLPSGTYQVVAYALSAATGQFDNVRVVQLIVP